MIVDEVIDSLRLPAAARINQRVPKSLLLENGASTSADRRLINEGVESLHWLAALKPANCGAPEFRDDIRVYDEIAILSISLRDGAKVGRVKELVHRAIPYPVLLVISHENEVSISVCHKRQALNEAGKVVLDGGIAAALLPSAGGSVVNAFLAAIDLGLQPRSNLYTLYQGWHDTLLTLQTAEITGQFTLLDSAERIHQRRAALVAHKQLTERISALTVAARKTSQTARQVALNIEIQRLRKELGAVHSKL